MKKIAIVGSGISGLSAAWALRETADVTVFEASDHIGGHSKTITINTSDTTVPVDVGFIVCNPLNYPNFMPFLDAINVETIESDMSFAVSDKNGFEWSSNKHGLFAYKRNLFNPAYISLLLEIVRFNKQAKSDVEGDTIKAGETLKAYLDQHGFSKRFRENYILPMGAAIWSTPEAKMDGYPATSFLNFFNNHKLIHYDRPHWRTVKDGSQTYVSALKLALGERIKANTPVTSARRTQTGVELCSSTGAEVFDDVIFACHAPQTHAILGDGYEQQASVLANIKTIPNTAYLHTDATLMPKRKAAWAAWNVIKGSDEKVSLSYWMNILQKLPTEDQVFVTLNPETEPAPELTHGKFDFAHPQFDLPAAEGVQALEHLNGRDGIWFAGAWNGYGFHEDGLKSGLRCALALGGTVPWTPVGIPPFPSQSTDETLLASAETIVAAQ